MEGNRVAQNARPAILVGQSGGPTAVINASLAGVIAEALGRAEVGDILGMVNGVQGLVADEPRVVDLRVLTEDGAALDALARTPASALGTCRFKPKDDELEKIYQAIRARNVGYVCYIGGNDSADTSARLAKLAESHGSELRVIGVPKTMDNDLAHMDHTPGYGSCARYVAIATQDSGFDTRAMRLTHPIKIVELLGRSAGWVAAAAALGKRDESDPPHLIYTPERRLSAAQFVKDVDETYKKYGYCVIVIGENIPDENGKPLGEAVDEKPDAFGHVARTGLSAYLSGLITHELHLSVRVDRPNTLQRATIIAQSDADREEAYGAGRAAVRLALDGKTGRMVTLERAAGSEYAISFGDADLEEVANAEKTLPEEYYTPSGNFVTQAFVDYARPLIGAALPSDGYVRFRLPR